MKYAGLKLSTLLFASTCAAAAWSATDKSPAAPAPQRGQGDAAQPGTDLKARYADKAAFLADVKKSAPSFAIELDGKSVRTGFGPPIAYRTERDGSVIRK